MSMKKTEQEKDRFQQYFIEIEYVCISIVKFWR